MDEGHARAKIIVGISEQLLLAVKSDKDIAEILKQINALSVEELKVFLNNDKLKKTFWINCYNAFFQILRKVKKLAKNKIYKSRSIEIAGSFFSLDDIEHGILRRNRFKRSLGLFTNPFAPSLLKELVVDELDYRIHFALNCGAKSCPPIAFYKSDKIDEQLDLATQSFLEGESKFDDKNKVVYTTALFKWYKFDFGGYKGVKEIYKDQLNRDIAGYSIKYNVYSWDELLDNYS